MMPWRHTRLAAIAASAFLLNPAPAAAGGNAFEALFARLDPAADLVVTVDLAEAGRAFKRLLVAVDEAPIVRRGPEIAAAWKAARKAVDDGMASLRKSMGLDPLADLDRAAVAVAIDLRQPRFALVVTGRFTNALLAKWYPDARERLEGKVKVVEDGKGMASAVPAPGVFVTGPKAAIARMATSGFDASALAARHPAFAAAPGEGFLLRASYAAPPWIRSPDTDPDLRARLSILLHAARIVVDFGDGLRVDAEAFDDAGATRLRWLATAVREAVVAYRSGARALVLGALGLGLDSMPAVPPPVARVLADHETLLATLDSFAGDAFVPPEVVPDGRKVSLRMDPPALKATVPVVGVLAAVAIPAFVKYMRRAKLSEAQVMVRQIRQAEELYRSEHDEYLRCGPVPRAVPKSAVPWPGDRCFDKLEFKPDGKVRFSYEVRESRDEPGGIEVVARGDLSGDGRITTVTAGPDGSMTVDEL